MVNNSRRGGWPRTANWLAVIALATQAATASAADLTASPVPSPQPLSQRLAQAALMAPSSAKNDGTLYGVQRWNAATTRHILGLEFPGMLSCAYTVSAIFNGASFPIGNLPAVASVDAALKAWPKIATPADLKPGDVVFWRPRTGLLRCPTTRHWHVGVAIGAGQTMDNDWWSGMPEKHALSRLCLEFAYARRAPE